MNVDPRVEQAQKLFWEIEALRRDKNLAAAAPKLLTMAMLHEQRAIELLEAGDPDGWIDLHAAVTAYAEADHMDRATLLLTQGRKLAELFTIGYEAILEELQETDEWLRLHTQEQPQASSDASSVRPRTAEFTTRPRTFRQSV